MNQIHDAMHNMPGLLVLGFFILLFVGAIGNELAERVETPINSLGTWLSFAAIFFFALAYHWPS